MITAIFNNKMDSTVAYGLWQWDYGQVLRIKGIDFSQFAIEIHFSFNEDDEDSTIAVGVVKEVEYESTILDDGETKVTSETIQVLDVTIPKDFLWNKNKKNYTIYVFLHLSNEEIGHTVKKILLPVKIKARPTYPHASEDEALFHSTLEQINELAETTVENAKIAKSYAVGDTGVREGEDTDNAKYYAEQASVSLEETTLQAENAEQSANNAKEYEENAELSANKAKEYELSSKTNADNAQGYMNWAYEYKDNAQEYSISARDYRDEAESAKNISLQASIDTGKVRDEVKDIQTDVKNIQTQINNIADSVDDTVIEINGLVEQVEINAETVATNTEITNQNKIATDEAKATAEEVLASSRQINADVLEIKNQIMGFADDATRVVDEGITEHDTSSTAHDDIRQLIAGLNDRLNTVLNSDDETLDQLSEIVDYIKDNRDLIETITSSKVNVSDIIDNLTTMSSNKPLSAKQGKILKDLIDAIKIPTKVSAFVNDKGYLTEQVQTNWTEEDSTNASFIQNKPSIVSGTGNGSVIEGSITGANANEASGGYSHAEGTNTKAQGDKSHAEGGNTIASGNYSHAEGADTTASGYFAHAEGSIAVASGPISHAEGSNTIASAKAQHVQGKFNIEDSLGKYAHIVGNGNYSTRSNAHTVDWSGNAWYQGKVSADGTPTDNNDLVPKSYVDDNLSKAFVEKSTSGSVVTFNDGAEMPMKSVVVDIEPVQDLNGYDSPWVGGSGKNLWHQNLKNGDVVIDGLTVGQTYTISAKRMEDVATYCYVRKKGVVDADFTTIGMMIKNNTVTPYTFTVEEDTEYALWCNATSYDNVIELQIEEGSIASEWTPYENICPITGHTGVTVVGCGVNIWDEEWEIGTLYYGNPTYNASRIRSKNYIPCKPNTTYYFNKGVNNGNMWASFYDRNKVCLNPTSNGDNVNDKIVTTPDKCHYMRFFLSAQTEYQHDVAINYPSTDHDYHSYVGQSIPISWESEAGTIYGGTIDIISGLLTVDKVTAVFDGTETVNNNYFPVVVFTKAFPVGANGTLICSHVTSSLVSYANSNRNTFQFRQCDTVWGVTSASELKTKFADEYANSHPVTVCYPLAEPITYQLSPNEIQSILGYNLVYSNVGDVDVTYLADIKTYMNETLTDYVKNTDYATADKGGVIKVPVYTNGYRGGMATIDGTLYSIGASIADIKLGIDLTKPLSAQNSTATTFYGLARASGDTTQSVSDNAIGNYTDEAKASIQNMLSVPSTEQLEDYTTLNTFYDDVIDNTTSGNNIVSFNDGANNLPIQDLTINIEPNQDLHGYDSPWPSGGGKNVMPYGEERDVTFSGIRYQSDGKGTYRISGTSTKSDSANFLLSESFVIPTSDTYSVAFLNNASSNSVQFKFMNGSTTIDTWTLSPINKTSTTYSVMGGATCDRVQIAIAANITVDMTIQPMLVPKDISLTTYIPYSNICPISGWEGCEVVQTGKNLIPKGIKSVGTFKPTGGTIIGSVYETLCFPVPKGRLHWKVDATGVCSYICLLDDIPASGVTVYNNVIVTNRSEWNLDNSAGHKYMAMFTSNFGKTEEEASAYITEHEIRVTYGDDTEFTEPVISTITPISWESEVGTVYGGVLDVLTGKLTITRHGFDGGDVNWSKTDSYAYGKFSTNTSPLAAYSATTPTIISSMYKSAANNSASADGNNYVWIRSLTAGIRQLRVKDELKDSMTVDEFKTAMTGVQFVYELAEPIEIQLDPHTLNTLLGYNNIYTDINSNISITYKANTKAYIDNKVMDNVPDLTSYVKNTDYATTTVGGVVKVSGTYGSGINSNGILYIYKASDTEVKAGTDSYKPITPNSQHRSVFYGLAKASGDTTQASSANAIGVYTNDAKTKIKTMLDIPTKTSELTNDSNFINTSYQIYAIDDDNGNVTIHFGILS